MRAWFFSENAYPDLPPETDYESIRVTLPNGLYEPKKGAALYDRYIDEWLVAEEEGLDIMLNEHHQTPTCVDPAAPLVLAALARLTSKARLLLLGNPISNRRDPVRVAEEMALADILTHGRLEVGFVRGVPYELAAANSNPVRTNERHWEALDLIIKAWTTRDGPFSHEGQFFHHRNVNIWPRPYQDPHPPVWVSATSPGGAARVGSRGFVQATFLTGFGGTPRVYESYRQGWREAGRGQVTPVNRLAYAPLLYTSPDPARARAGAEQLLWYLKANKVPVHYKNPPGYVPVDVNVRFLRGAMPQLAASIKDLNVEKAIEAGIMFAGTPDQVFDQVKHFYDKVGGFGHMLLMGQAGFLNHEDTVHGIRTFAREVYPRLKEAFPDDAASGAEQERAHVLAG
ncbi:LLM class flavin-dependent oxidoreductase [Sinorhizobium fredii]|uniref:LLM class flavin-dependent oxidoreductase n=2 Tax=Rhizobium fredii TaxID=380 RepID=UPI001295D581|nr:LLM class flavin-dependent oxidoreductase [Sinorhizobium fredii]MQW98141.1 LLM class flavin-dependent oxidoreductase [Sinorhizobium fredii]UTY47085.1 LLM class flavin-dependent oxidoreductase [Sinorhizobium fredii]